MAEAGKFFISLGLNGAEKTLSGLSQVNDHFGGLKTLSTEAKLAILAALAGLEQLVSVGGKFGSQMTMLHEHLNVSIQDLQKYGNAAQIAGSSVQSMYTAFGNIQDALESLRLEGKAAPFFPALMALIQQSGQNVTPEEVLKMGNTPGGDVKFFNLLRGMINNSKVNKFDLYKMISDNGMLPTDIYDVLAMNGGKTFDKALKMAPTVSTSTVGDLNKLNMQWEQTLERFETALKNFADAPWIMTFVKGLDTFADAVNKFVVDKNNASNANSRESFKKLFGVHGDTLDRILDTHLDKNGGFSNITKIYITATGNESQKTGQKAVDALNKGGFRATMTPTPAKFSSTVTK